MYYNKITHPVLQKDPIHDFIENKKIQEITKTLPSKLAIHICLSGKNWFQCLRFSTGTSLFAECLNDTAAWQNSNYYGTKIYPMSFSCMTNCDVQTQISFSLRLMVPTEQFTLTNIFHTLMSQQCNVGITRWTDSCPNNNSKHWMKIYKLY